MVKSQIHSEAFEQALLRSERLRAASVLGAIIALFLIGTAYSLIAGQPSLRSLPGTGALIAPFVLLEFLHLLTIRRALAGVRRIPRPVWGLTAAVETLLPTVCLWFLTESSLLGPYTALLVPVALLYFVFILLSVLRLRPGLCVLTGLVSMLGYCAVALYTSWRYPGGLTQFPLPFARYVTMYATMLLLSGFLAAGISWRIRKHVIAALREAEVRRQMERMERDLDIARSIQQSLLPSTPPEINGFDIAGWSQPADQTGGDYFDWQVLPDGRVAITLADVAGHGIGPALVTADCRAYARAILPTVADLGEAITQINRLLSQDLTTGRFVTYVAAIVDPSTGQVQLLSAGHGPLLLYTVAEHSVQRFDADGLPMGVVSSQTYHTPRHLDLGPGDVLLLLTDGFFEWANEEGEHFGIDRLQHALRDHASLAADELIARLHAAVLDFVGSTKQDDDLTAVAIKRSHRRSRTGGRSA